MGDSVAQPEEWRHSLKRERNIDELTPKQRLFAQEYLVDLNATQAAIRAGYSRKTARKIGQENLTKPDIQAVVDEALEARAERTRVTADKVVTELAKLDFSDLREVASWGSFGLTWKDSENLTGEAAACVQEINYKHEVRYDQNGYRVETGTMKMKLHDKKGALKMLGEHLGIFGANNPVVANLADTFMSGVHTVKSMQVEDLSE